MRVTTERLKARAEQLRKQGLKVRRVLDSVTGHTQKSPETTASPRPKKDSEEKPVEEHVRLAS